MRSYIQTRLFFIVLVLSQLIYLSATLAQEQVEDFPNYLIMDEQERSLAPEAISGLRLEESIDKWSKALQSFFRRLEVPVMIDGQPTKVKYFEYVETELRKIDRNVEVLPSGGVLRAAISYLYSYVYQQKELNSRLEVKDILKQFIKDAVEIDALEFRGVASDFDVLIRSYDPKNKRRLVKKAEEITEGPEIQFNARNVKNERKRSIFMVPDFKDYSEQTSRSTAQGGSEIDFLSFSLRAGTFIEPPNIQGIVNRLFRGLVVYRKPVSPDAIEDGDKQTIRGLRPLLELPFIQIANASVLIEELNQLKVKASKGIQLSAKSMQQFGKMIRNARFSGANNRLYKGAPGSVEAAAMELVKLIQLKNNKANLVPEFVDHLPLDRQIADHSLEGFLVSKKEFISKHTNNGEFYHGTPDFLNGLGIIRGGLFVSGGQNSQGTSIMGRGGYASPNYSTAMDRAKSEGLIIRLSLKNNKLIRILDWKQVQNSPAILEIEKRYPQQDLFEVLAKHYGIDIIVNHHILIQNINAIEHPRSLNEIVEMMASSYKILEEQLKNGLRFSIEHLKIYSELMSYFNYAKAIGTKDLPPKPDGRVLTSAFLRGAKWDKVGSTRFNMNLQSLIKISDIVDLAEFKNLLPPTEPLFEHIFRSSIYAAKTAPFNLTRSYAALLKVTEIYDELDLLPETRNSHRSEIIDTLKNTTSRVKAYIPKYLKEVTEIANTLEKKYQFEDTTGTKQFFLEKDLENALNQGIWRTKYSSAGREKTLRIPIINDILKICAIIDCSRLKKILPQLDEVFSELAKMASEEIIKYPSVGIRRFSQLLALMKIYESLGISSDRLYNPVQHILDAPFDTREKFSPRNLQEVKDLSKSFNENLQRDNMQTSGEEHSCRQSAS